MERRTFLQNIATTTAAAALSQVANASPLAQAAEKSAPASLDGHTQVAEFHLNATPWKVYEDLRTRDGVITFVSSTGARRVLGKTAEAQFPGDEPPHLGISMDDIGLSGPDLLADKLLASGDDPDPAEVKKAAPPQGSPQPPRTPPAGLTPQQLAQFNAAQNQGRARWDHIVGTRQAWDCQPVFPGGGTRTYHPNQYFQDIRGEAVSKRFDGLIGGWMPAVRKVMPTGDNSYIEVVVFGDVEAKDKFIIQTWHRTSKVENGKVTKVVYGYTYPEFPPARLDPKPAEFYRALLVFAKYWEKELHDVANTQIPDEDLLNMARFAFSKEIMVRPEGYYPKYGAIDRDYYGSEYDGFQDIFTMSTYTNLEWGRFGPVRAIVDNYLSDFTDARGNCNMRGPETAQYGMTLMLLARYFNYTRDAALIQRHRSKIAAIAKMLVEMHDESLKRPTDDPGHGLIHGWSESDACLAGDPSVWWLPYYANSAFAARGLHDIAVAWPEIARVSPMQGADAEAKAWLDSSKLLRQTTVDVMEKNVSRDDKPPYIGTWAGSKGHFRDSFGQPGRGPNKEQWAHRPYAELLQADVLPADLANTVIDCMRAYGATTIGVVANVGPARPGARAILGFISYGYAQMLLRLDRVEEYLLFLHAHRYHDHTRGSWTAGEVSGINGGTAIFCIPAQQTIPLLVRWMLVLEDSDDDRLYFARGVPRAWTASGKPIRIEQAPTRFGRVSLNLVGAGKKVTATVDLAKPGSPKEIHVKLRVPKSTPLQSATVNGKPAKLAGKNGDTVVIATGAEKHFEVVGTTA